MRSKKLNVSELAEVSPLIEKLIGDIWLEIESDKESKYLYERIESKHLSDQERINTINYYERRINDKYHKLQGLEKIYSWINNKELHIIDREEN